MNTEKQNKACSVSCELIYNNPINKEIFRLDFIWQGSSIPKAGQFFMIKPKRSAIFLGRPISMAMWQPAVEDKDYIRRKARSKKSPYQRYLTGKYLESNSITFLIIQCGKGTEELASMKSGEEAELIGPLGNAWEYFLPPTKNNHPKSIALVGGSLGIAPLLALLGEFEDKPGYCFDTYAGFKTSFANLEVKNKLMGTAIQYSEKTIIATEDGKDGLKGRITDFLEPEKYDAVFSCGPEPMLKAVAAKCNSAGVPCFISMDKRMACGVGACLGCTVKTVNGNRRCCADGPIFKADEVIFDE